MSLVQSIMSQVRSRISSSRMMKSWSSPSSSFLMTEISDVYSWSTQLRYGSSDSPTNKNHVGKKQDEIHENNGNERITMFHNHEDTIYVHPLSQIVLEHLQENRSDWTTQQNMTRLTIDSTNGTIQLKNDDNMKNKKKIWTSFEPEDKTHWLHVAVNNNNTPQENDTDASKVVVGRYLLQDNLKPAWHSDSRSTHKKVKNAVDAMIEKLSSIP